MPIQHKKLAEGMWFKLSLTEQMGNIGSELSRALHWRNKNERLFRGAIERAFELLDLTIQDRRWRKRLKEITMAREFLCDAILDGKEYGSKLEDIERYFFHFAVFARKNK